MVRPDDGTIAGTVAVGGGPVAGFDGASMWVANRESNT
jgi:hypothetical protein